MTTIYTTDANGWRVYPDEADLRGEMVFPDFTKFGNWTTFGNGTTFGNWTTFGDGTTFGNDTTMEGIANARLLCLSNVDGSGRQVQIIVGDGPVLIRAGCFRGTVEEFVAKASAEGKDIYAAVIPAAAAALVAQYHRTADVEGAE